MDQSIVGQILEKQVLSVAKAVEDKLDEQIAALDRLDPDDIEALRERRILQMRRAAERRAKWRALGHGEYGEVPEKEFFAAAKASDRLVCHFYRDNWPCKCMQRVCAVPGFGRAWPCCGTVRWRGAGLRDRAVARSQATGPAVPRIHAAPTNRSCMSIPRYAYIFTNLSKTRI
ncbi:thioredoxin domain-containing protein 9 homolog isoform X2 [Oryza sativa Japonica Group]|uniref:thioredoxin domain-containing protein 9 homolog isoform X2 n=1 Tax=Oryza sativa subsp. japonica TaxID=39947 RepID=UPI00339CB03F